MRGLLLCFSLPVYAALAPRFLSGLLRDLPRPRFSLDNLIALGATAAFRSSCAAAPLRRGELYFNSACAVLFVTLGRLPEAQPPMGASRAAPLPWTDRRSPQCRDGAREALAAAQAADSALARALQAVEQPRHAASPRERPAGRRRRCCRSLCRWRLP